MSTVSRIVNTWDQNVAAGGDRIAIFYQSDWKWRSACWHVLRFRNGKELATDPDAHWEDDGCKAFLIRHPIRTHKDAALREAIAWAVRTYGPREFVRNRMGDHVEREVNERFPIPRRERGA